MYGHGSILEFNTIMMVSSKTEQFELGRKKNAMGLKV
jgi:hypothetical protein